MVVKTTKVGIVKNALSMLAGSKSKEGFVEALVKGIGANYHSEDRKKFA